MYEFIHVLNTLHWPGAIAVIAMTGIVVWGIVSIIKHLW
jgi:hypothetical protein